MLMTTTNSTTDLAAPAAWMTDLAEPPGAKTLTLATVEWQKLEFGVQAVLNLPSNTSEQTARYGSADRISGLQGFFDASGDLSHCAENYGSPKALRALLAKDPNYLASDTEPDDNWLASVMWILQSTARTSFTIAEIFGNAPAASEGVSAADVVAGLQELFAPVFDQMQVQSDELLASIKTLSKLSDDMKEASATMTSFTATTSALVASVDENIGDLQHDMNEYTAEARKAFDAMVAYATTAGVTGVLAIVGAGATTVAGPAIPVAAAATAALTTVSATMAGLAGDASKKYESLLEKIAAVKKEVFQDLTLKNDLTAIDNTCNFDLPSVSTTSGTLSGMQRAWSASLKNLQGAVGQLTPDTVQSGPWLDPDTARSLHDSWAELSTAIDYFISGGIVDSVLVPFGDPLPPQAA